MNKKLQQTIIRNLWKKIQNTEPNFYTYIFCICSYLNKCGSSLWHKASNKLKSEIFWFTRCHNLSKTFLITLVFSWENSIICCKLFSFVASSSCQTCFIAENTKRNTKSIQLGKESSRIDGVKGKGERLRKMTSPEKQQQKQRSRFVSTRLYKYWLGINGVII